MWKMILKRDDALIPVNLKFLVFVLFFIFMALKILYILQKRRRRKKAPEPEPESLEDRLKGLNVKWV